MVQIVHTRGHHQMAALLLWRRTHVFLATTRRGRKQKPAAARKAAAPADGADAEGDEPPTKKGRGKSSEAPKRCAGAGVWEQHVWLLYALRVSACGLCLRHVRRSGPASL